VNVIRIIIVAGMLAVVVVAAGYFTTGPGLTKGSGHGLAGSAPATITSPEQAGPALPKGMARDEQVPVAVDMRFSTVDVYVSSGDQPLAAYQFVVQAATQNVLLAGLEGGEHAAFRQAPYYDPKALLGERVVVAAFSTADALPRGRTRVARLHVQVSGDKDPEYIVTLQTAAGPDGGVIAATVTVESSSK